VQPQAVEQSLIVARAGIARRQQAIPKENTVGTSQEGERL
jgi:hypothetical protein